MRAILSLAALAGVGLTTAGLATSSPALAAEPLVTRVPANAPHLATSRILWADTIHRLQSDTSLEQLGTGLFVVQIADGLDPAELLAGLETLHVTAPTSGQHGVALVRITDPDRRDRLAVDVHEATGRCGALQPLTVPEPTADPVGLAAFAAIHPEDEALPEVRDLIGRVSPGAIMQAVTTLEGQGTRYHGSETGQATPELIATLACELAGADPCPLELEYVTHAQTLQQSLIISLPGASDDDTTVVLGAHLDSINRSGSSAPGADDDATGVATLLEILRVLLATDAQLDRRVELHFYAAEEIGLVGSDEIASSYSSAGRSVHAMLQCDMNGYGTGTSRTIHLVTNDTSSALNDSLAALLDTYLGGDYRRSVLTAGTSDHRSWSRRGFVAAFPTENPQDFNPYIHTTGDTSDRVDTDRSARFAALALTFVAHHAGITVEEPEPVILDDDLKVAIRRPGSAVNQFDLVVATPETIERVRVCNRVATDSASCLAVPSELVAAAARGGRRFFINPAGAPLTLADGDTLLLEGLGFDASGSTQVLQRRTLTVGM